MPTHDEMSDRIFRTLRSRKYEPSRLKELTQLMRIAHDEMGDFHAACKALMKTGRIVLGSGQTVSLPPPSGTVTGTYRSNPRGFGFVIPDDPNMHGDLFVRSNDSGGAMTGDTVKAKVMKRGLRDGKMKYEGLIVTILKRGQNRFVGELYHRGKRWFIVPNGNTLHMPIMVGDPGAKGANAHDQVVVEITRYPSDQSEARGVIVKVLGKSGESDVDTKGIIEQHGFNEEFDDAVMNNAREVTQAYDPDQLIDQREDLRKETILTIDPYDARDFDDAISLKTLDNQHVELGVHIADVSHFVREDSPLDKEAHERATSVYLPRKVIPMLPEVLSNGVCSLQENEDRVTKSVFITYDSKAKICGVRFANTVIRSTKRLTYEQATDILAGKPGQLSSKIVDIVKQMGKLAERIQKRRVREGMLELDLPEIDLVFDNKGNINGVKPTDTSYSHKVIEMFMVEANEAVARLFVKLSVPCLRRIHDEPDGLRAGAFQKFLRAVGYDFPDDGDRFDVQALLKKVRGKDESYTVQIAVLRTMSEAEYSPRLIGHYALASKDYCHFTSPIRRYADLMVHRLLDRYHAGEFSLKTKAGVKNVADTTELMELAAHCSSQSRQAEAAERELKQLLILRLLENRLDDEFDGIVTGVVNMGVFVQLKDYLIDGLIRFEHMSEDWWEIDSSGSSVVGTSTGQRITVGDRLKVHIRSIHIPMRQMELGLSGMVKAKGKGRAHTKEKARAKGSKKYRKLRVGDTRLGGERDGDARVVDDDSAKATSGSKTRSGGRTGSGGKTGGGGKAGGGKKGHRGQAPGRSRTKKRGESGGGSSGGSTSSRGNIAEGKTVGGKTGGGGSSSSVRKTSSGNTGNSQKSGGGKTNSGKTARGKTSRGKTSRGMNAGGPTGSAKTASGEKSGEGKAGSRTTTGEKTGGGKAGGGKLTSRKKSGGYPKNKSKAKTKGKSTRKRTKKRPGSSKKRKK